MYSKEEIKELRLNFWQSFKSYCETREATNYSRKRWMLNETQIRGLALRFDVDRENAWVILELQHKNEDRRLQTFEILERYKVVMEEGFEKGLIWEFYHRREDNGQEVCRIYTRLENADWHDKEWWPDIYNFFIKNMLQMEHNYLELKEVIKEELRNQ
ncbi:MAG TPA: DUF4268 domain-containing protein [Draconibacterium sp.]|nr:DUF4268 domain-containing protein [Draconibacterium sp.]